MIALLEAYKAGALKNSHFVPNILAGLVVGIVALPMAMAFAIASGVKPEQGITTAIIAGIVVAIFGGSRVQIAGPTGAFIVILSGVTAQYGVEGLQLATLIGGILLLCMGLMRLGSIIKFIPYPVVIGFTSAIAIVIFISQWKDFFGLPLSVPAPSHLHERLFQIINTFPKLHQETTLLGLFSLALMVSSTHIKYLKKIPAPLITMIFVTILQVIFKFEGVATIGSAFGQIPANLPRLQIPTITYDKILLLLPSAFAIAMLGAIESLLSAVIADGLSSTRHNSNQELIGQGLANMLCPLFGGFAAAGAIARTATNIRHGGNNPIAGIVHSVFLIFCILILAPYATHVPLCALAAVLFVVSYNMCEAHHFIFLLKKGTRPDVAVLIVTFFLTLLADLIIAINVGVLLSVLFFVKRMSKSIQVEIETTKSLEPELSSCGMERLPKEVMVYNIQGPFFFGAVEILQQTLHLTHQNPEYVIFRLKYVPFIDSTGLKCFYDIIQTYHSRHIKVYLCEASAVVQKKLLTKNLSTIIEGGKIYDHCETVIREIPSNGA
jgi:SulP family sulfate permease